MVDVHLDRADRDVQLARDFAVGQAAGHQRRNLGLTPGQSRCRADSPAVLGLVVEPERATAISSDSRRPSSRSFAAARAPRRENRRQPLVEVGPDRLRPIGVVDPFVLRRGTGQHERMPGPAPLGRQPGQGAQPARQGEAVAQFDEGGHTLRERRPGASQVAHLRRHTPISIGHAH